MGQARQRSYCKAAPGPSLDAWEVAEGFYSENHEIINVGKDHLDYVVQVSKNNRTGVHPQTWGQEEHGTC